MCVGVGWGTVGCPASVTDANVSVWKWVRSDLGLQIAEFSGLFASLEVAVGDNRDAGRVISAIFESAKASDKHIYGRFWAYVADDSTHTTNLVDNDLL